MDKFFSIFGKIVLVIIILGAMTYGGYYLGTQTKDTSKAGDISKKETIVKTEDTSTPSTAIGSDEPQSKTIVAGVSKSAGLSFDQYSIIIPNGWQSKKESQTALDEKLILTKNEYIISIFQAATGGALCLYTGDPDFEGPSSRFEAFTVLTSKDGRTLRRSGEKNGTGFTVCQKSADGSYQQPTNYGHISIKLPTTWNEEGLKEVDSIISSLKKI